MTHLQMLSLCSIGATSVLHKTDQQQPETVSIMKQIKIHGLLLVRVLGVCVCVCVCVFVCVFVCVCVCDMWSL